MYKYIFNIENSTWYDIMDMDHLICMFIAYHNITQKTKAKKKCLVLFPVRNVQHCFKAIEEHSKKYIRDDTFYKMYGYYPSIPYHGVVLSGSDTFKFDGNGI